MSTIEKATQKEQMYALIEQSVQSKISKRLFCQEQGIAPSSFYYWQKKYRQEQIGQPGFIPVIVKKSSQDLYQTLEVEYPSGVKIKVPSGSSVTLLKTLIDLI